MDSSDSERVKTPEEAGSANLLVAIDAAIVSMQKHLQEKGLEKGSLTDLVRLLQLRRELEGERPRHVSVRWIDECKSIEE